MNNKLLTIFAGIILIAVIQPSEAKPNKKEPLLDVYTRRIIYNRICKAQRNEQYTSTELFDYTENMVRINGNLDKILSTHSPIEAANIEERNGVNVIEETSDLLYKILENKKMSSALPI